MSKNPTDTNQASEELREMFKAFVDSGYHACYCARSLDNGCECAIKDEYIDKVMTAIQSFIRTEKLKLLAEVRERVVGEDMNVANMGDTFKTNYARGYNVSKVEMRDNLAKMEAEL